jgi:hypothetical protein
MPSGGARHVTGALVGFGAVAAIAPFRDLGAPLLAYLRRITAD